MLLEEKTTIITGCNRGIGKAILERSAEEGSDIFAVVRKETEEFQTYCKQLADKYAVQIIPVSMEFADENSVKEGAKKILSFKKKIDILINNAGVSLPLRSLSMTKMETIHEVFQINYFSQMLLTQAVSKNMMRYKGGSIVFVSSSAAYDGGANIEYSSSKAALIGAVKRLALEYGPYNIRVNAVAPGLTETDMGNSMSEEDEKMALSMNIMKRKGNPKEIADSVLFLASDLSSFVTAQVLRVDGGLR